MCLRGASEVTKITASCSDPNLKTYVAWVPKMFGRSRHVAEASKVVHDSRVTHFWDESELLMSGYRRTLGIDEDAWDIYMIYGPDARWDGDAPPKPLYWSHQLGSKAEPRQAAPYLDPETFAKKLAEIQRM